MKNIDLKIQTPDTITYGDIIASISGNNFGDQKIEFRRYAKLDDNLSGFRTIYTITNYEGEHWSKSDMMLFLNNGLPKGL